MRELPQFVLERLKRSAPPAGHPDADVLTAFAERLLPAPERAVVSEHLARCGDCRDVIALAIPASAVETKEVVAPFTGARVRWWNWPVLRGAAFAASVVAVAAVGIYEYQHRKPATATVAGRVEQAPVPSPPLPNETKTAESRQESVVSHAEQNQEAAPSPPKLLAEKPSSRTGGGLALRAKSMAAPAGSSRTLGDGSRLAPGTKMAMAEPPRDLALASRSQEPSAQMKKQIPAPLSASAGQDAPATASQTLDVQSQPETVTVEAQAPTRLLQAENTNPQSPFESTEDVRRAKPAATIGGTVSASSAATVGGPPVAARNQLDLGQDYQTASPLWTISSEGGLQRSLDGGKTWQGVNVHAKPGFYAGSMQVANASNEQAAKQFAKKAARNAKDNEANNSNSEEKSAALETASAPVFRAVAAIGTEVWAGGSGGLLYHSSDAGTLWSRTIPSAQGVTLSGDIVGIEFLDVVHGKVVTSTSETWRTADGGQSWRKE
jgi:Photosynthesis system II assembly factor YCF48